MWALTAEERHLIILWPLLWLTIYLCPHFYPRFFQIGLLLIRISKYLLNGSLLPGVSCMLDSKTSFFDFFFQNFRRNRLSNHRHKGLSVINDVAWGGMGMKSLIHQLLFSAVFVCDFLWVVTKLTIIVLVNFSWSLRAEMLWMRVSYYETKGFDSLDIHTRINLQKLLFSSFIGSGIIFGLLVAPCRLRILVVFSLLVVIWRCMTSSF